MRNQTRPLEVKRLRAIIALAAFVCGTPAVRAQTLGAAETFAIVGGSSVTAGGTGSVVNGDVGVSPGTSITGFPASATTVPPFTTHANDGAAMAAQASVTSLYTTLASAGPCTPLAMQLNGVTVGPGVHCFSSTADLAATGTLTLNGAGIYIFQVGSSLTANVLSNVVLINGADPCDVFWQVTDAATINGTTFVGNVVAQAGVTMSAGTMSVGVNLIGRALATAAGNVTLAGFNTVGGCSLAETPTATATATGTDTPTATATATGTDTPNATVTETPTATATATGTDTPNATASATETPTASATATGTATQTATPTNTATPTTTATAVATGSSTATSSATFTPSAAGTATATTTATPTETPTSSPTQTPTLIVTGTATATTTATASATATASGTPTATVTATPSLTRPPIGATPTSTVTPTRTTTLTPTATRTRPPIPVIASPTSGSGLLLIGGLALTMVWMLWRSSQR